MLFERRMTNARWRKWATFVKHPGEQWRPLGWHESPGGRRELGAVINQQWQDDMDHRRRLEHHRPHRRKRRTGGRS